MALHQGDCLDVLKTLPENSIDALVTDPPAGISFMGKDWDHHKGGRKEWCAWMESVMRECLRVMKPGAHGLVWALPRTSHWTATALEDAGFEIRDCIYHLFGSGFPKSLDVSKAIDKAAGAKRKVIGRRTDRAAAPVRDNRGGNYNSAHGKGPLDIGNITAPATEDAKKWQGFGTALKPAVECWWLVRKPLSEKTVAANVLKWGTGALNIDSSRITSDTSQDVTCNNCGDSISCTSTLPTASRVVHKTGKNNPALSDVERVSNNDLLPSALSHARQAQRALDSQDDCHPSHHSGDGHAHLCAACVQGIVPSLGGAPEPLAPRAAGPHNRSTSMACAVHTTSNIQPLGRFPSHLVLSHSPHCTDTQCDIECAIKMLDAQSGTLKSGDHKSHYFQKPSENRSMSGANQGRFQKDRPGDAGGASRFFYCAKVSASERNAGFEDAKQAKAMSDARPNSPDMTGKFPDHDGRIKTGNFHPTVKPQKLMRYLCKLITPPGGTILDPFMGSGSTGLAAKSEGFGFVGIEKEAEYFEIAKARLAGSL